MFSKLLVDAIPWGGVVTLSPLPISGNPFFDYFFTIILYFGLVACMIGWLVNIITRS